MASTNISAITTLITGATSDSGAVTSSGDTCTITGPTGDALDLSSLVIRIANEATGSGAIVTIEASSTYSAYGVGDYNVTVGTAATVYVGGKGLESARFLQTSSQALLLTFVSSLTASASTCACTIEALQGPFQITG